MKYQIVKMEFIVNKYMKMRSMIEDIIISVGDKFEPKLKSYKLKLLFKL